MTEEPHQDRDSKPPVPVATSALPIWQVVIYSCGIIGALFLGLRLAGFVGLPHLRSTIKTVPILICLLFVLRLPRRPPASMHRVWRVLFLLSPLPLFFFADLDFPTTMLDRPTMLAFVVLESLAIGVSEEVTFRYSLHRLWSQYSATFFVVGSALIFGILHIPLGAQIAIVSTIIGVQFALARIAGMPLAVLVVLHGLFDAPAVMRFLGDTYGE